MCSLHFSRIFIVLALSSVNAVSEQVVDFHYDTQGRLTFVEDTANKNRDYNYDAAGNRVSVRLTTDEYNPVFESPPPTQCEIECQGNSECMAKNPVCEFFIP